MGNDKLDKIPDNLASHMKTVIENKAATSERPLDTILKQKMKKAPPKKNKAPQVIELNGFKIYDDQFSMLFFRLVFMKNTEVDQLLTEAEFTMRDLSGKIIFPRTNELSK